MKENCISELLIKLGGSKREEQDYVFTFFTNPLLSNLDKIDEAEVFLRDWAVTIFTEGLKAGDKRFYELSETAIKYHKVFWKDSLKESFDSFQEVGPTPTDTSEDIPF